MTEETDWKKFLAEQVLKEIWHKSDGTYLGQKCVCGRECEWPRETLDEHIKRKNRTFDNQDDMMELYRYIYEDGKWNTFESEIYARVFIPCYYEENIFANNFNAWLFCLGDEYYESRCKLVAKFYEWEEGK